MKLTFPKVLIIDDDQPFASALTRWLSDLGYQPSVALSARDGAALLEQGDFAVILLDLHLPDVSGHAIMRQLKNAGAAIPVIVISGTAEMDDVVRAWRENAADFLRKPFRVDDLAAALDRALKRGKANAPSSSGDASASAIGARPEASLPAPNVATTPSPAAQLRPAVTKLVGSLKAGAVRLPILDPKVVRLPEFLTTQGWAVEELVDTVTRDSNLAAGILRTANSAAYSRGKTITSLREACLRLGSKAVVVISFEITVKSQFTVPQEPFKTALKSSWLNAVVASRVAVLLGELLRIPDLEELRLVTLFHNLGELLSICLLAELERPTAGALTLAQLAAEVDVMHEELGAALATSWKLPASVIRVAGHHHRPAPQTEASADALLRNLVLASWSIALRAGFTYFPGQEDVDPRGLLNALGLTEQQVEPVFEKIKTWQIDG